MKIDGFIIQTRTKHSLNRDVEMLCNEEREDDGKGEIEDMNKEEEGENPAPQTVLWIDYVE